MTFTKILVACLAAGALTAPSATADDATIECALVSQWVHPVVRTYAGTAHGYVVHGGDPDATVRCYVEVDGVEVSSTPTGVGVTAGPVTFPATATGVVRLCGVSDAHGSTARCAVWPAHTIPWDDVFYVLELIFHTNPVDPLVCGFLDDFAGTYADAVEIGSDGDVYVNGQPEWDCPPYQHWPPG